MDVQKLRNPRLPSLMTKQGFLNRRLRQIRTRKSLARTGLDFIPVRVSEAVEPVVGEDRIEIRFPSGIEVALTGKSALSMAEALISRR